MGRGRLIGQVPVPDGGPSGGKPVGGGEGESEGGRYRAGGALGGGRRGEASGQVVHAARADVYTQPRPGRRAPESCGLGRGRAGEPPEAGEAGGRSRLQPKGCGRGWRGLGARTSSAEEALNLGARDESAFTSPHCRQNSFTQEALNRPRTYAEEGRRLLDGHVLRLGVGFTLGSHCPTIVSSEVQAPPQMSKFTKVHHHRRFDQFSYYRPRTGALP
jgi:hypothetical protein